MDKNKSIKYANKNKIFLKPALTLKTRLISIKQINKGSNVGYDGTWTATENSIIGILPIGYADGYPSSLSNKGYVLVDNKNCSVSHRTDNRIQFVSNSTEAEATVVCFINNFSNLTKFAITSSFNSKINYY